MEENTYKYQILAEQQTPILQPNIDPTQQINYLIQPNSLLTSQSDLQRSFSSFQVLSPFPLNPQFQNFSFALGSAFINFLGSFLEIVTWITMFFFIMFSITSSRLFWFAVLLSYVVGVLLQLCIRFCLRSKERKSILRMKDKIDSLFSEKPEVTISVCCYHYETRTCQVEENGKTVTKSIKQRIDTYKETKKFEYYSLKDVSGAITFDLDKNTDINSHWILPLFTENLYFADSLTCYDYNAMKNEIYERNKSRDEHILLSENINISGFKNTGRVKVKKIDLTWHDYVSIFLLVSYPYRLFSNCSRKMMANKVFHIRKVISSRYKINDPSFKKYSLLTPSLKIYKNTYNYQPNEFGYCNQSVQPKEPTKEEVASAKIYNELIPTYRLSDTGPYIDFPEQPARFEIDHLYAQSPSSEVTNKTLEASNIQSINFDQNEIY